MLESELSNITLLDVINSQETSLRLRNCIEGMFDSLMYDYMPGYLTDISSIKTVAGYLRAGENARKILLRLPNMGVKSFNELDELINNVIDAEGMNKPSTYRFDQSDDIPSDVASQTISEYVESNDTSQRLRNSIRLATNNGVLPFETIIDYIKAGSNALSIIQEVPNLGKKTAIELNDLIRDIFSNADVSGGMGTPLMKTNKLEINVTDSEQTPLEKFHKILKEREYNVLKYRAIEDITLEDIGQIYNLTRERVRQIQKKVISKLHRVYGEVFNTIAGKIDEILDDAYGEIRLIDAASTLNLTPETLRLLIFVCADSCVDHVRIKDGYILRSSTEDNHSEWNKVIDETLYSTKWPIRVSHIYENTQELPQSYVLRYLLKNRGAIIKDDHVIELRKIPQTVRMIYVLRDAGRPLHSAEIAKRYHLMFGKVIKAHNAQSIIARMDEALIVNRGVYALYETLKISEDILDEIRYRSYNYIRDEKRYVSSKILYSELFKDKQEYQSIDSGYIIHGILQDDTRFVIRRGMMVGIKENEGNVEFKSLTHEVCEFVERNGQVSISQIKEALSGHRKVLDVNISMILDGSDKIVRVMPGIYDSSINVFGTKHLYEKFKLAIRIALTDHNQGLFELTKNLRFPDVFNIISITKSLVVSVLSKMEDIKIKNQYYYIISNKKEIEIYNTISSEFIKKSKSIIEIKKGVEKLIGAELTRNYIEADYRLQTIDHEIHRRNSKASGESGEINSILSAFEI